MDVYNGLKRWQGNRKNNLVKNTMRTNLRLVQWMEGGEKEN